MDCTEPHAAQFSGNRHPSRGGNIAPPTVNSCPGCSVICEFGFPGSLQKRMAWFEVLRMMIVLQQFGRIASPAMSVQPVLLIATLRIALTRSYAIAHLRDVLTLAIKPNQAAIGSAGRFFGETWRRAGNGRRRGICGRHRQWSALLDHFGTFASQRRKG